MIDHDETLGDFASFVGVSSAFVSSVLTGKKNIPDDWYDKICEHYPLNNADKTALYDAYCETKNSIKIDVVAIPAQAKRVALQFQRQLPTLSTEDLEAIRKILEEK